MKKYSLLTLGVVALIVLLAFTFTSFKSKGGSYADYKPRKEICSPSDPAVVRNLQLIGPHATLVTTLGSVTFDEITFDSEDDSRELLDEVWEVCGKPVVLTTTVYPGTFSVSKKIYYNGNAYTFPEKAIAIETIHNSIAYKSELDDGNILVGDQVFGVSKVDDIRSLGGKIVATVDSDSGTEVWLDNKKIGLYKKGSVSQWTLINDTLVFSAIPYDATETDPFKIRFSLFQDGKIISSDTEYVGGPDPWGKIVFVTDYQGFPAYIAGTEPAWKELEDSSVVPAIPNPDGKYNVIWKGKKVSDRYTQIFHLQTIGGKLAFLGVRDKKPIIVYDGKEYGSKYDWVGNLMDANGTLAYMGMLGEEGTASQSMFIVKGKEVLATAISPRGFSYPTFVKDKLAFIMDNSDTGEYFIMYGEEKIFTGDVSRLAEIRLANIGDKLTFSVGGSFFTER